MTIQEELEAIREENDGLLRADDVVEFARANPESSLHRKFTWDDTLAAQQYRLMQARGIIRVNVITPETTGMTVRAYVSMMGDRLMPGGGYRSLSDIMGNDELRRQLLTQALKEARTWREKYKNLQELAGVFGAIDEVAPEGVLPAAPTDGEPLGPGLVA